MLNNRQIWLLRALGIAAALELIIGRVVLPVLRRRWASTAALPWLDVIGIVLVALLLGGGTYLVVWLARTMFAGEQTVGRARMVAFILLIALSLVEATRLGLGDITWIDLVRHSLAIVLILVVTVDAQLHATSLARAAVSFAGISLLFATLYRGASLYFVTGASTRWLAVGSETAGLLLPWTVVIAVVRGEREDWYALGVAIVTFIASALVIWGVNPSIRQLIAQGVGFGFSLPPLVHVLGTAMFAFFITRALLSEVVPAQMAWAFIWLTFSGIQMNYPQVEFCSIVALAIFAWTPPLNLPRNLFRKPQTAANPT